MTSFRPLLTPDKGFVYRSWNWVQDGYGKWSAHRNPLTAEEKLGLKSTDKLIFYTPTIIVDAESQNKQNKIYILLCYMSFYKIFHIL